MLESFTRISRHSQVFVTIGGKKKQTYFLRLARVSASRSDWLGDLQAALVSMVTVLTSKVQRPILVTGPELLDSAYICYLGSL
jgi:hypothetical protein